MTEHLLVLLQVDPGRVGRRCRVAAEDIGGYRPGKSSRGGGARPRGQEFPVIRIHGRSQRRFSIAALTCYEPGERSRLIYRPERRTDHKRGSRRSFAWTEDRDLLNAAHHQLGGPIALVWDNLNVHKDARMRAFIDACE
ncbi:hypothetical protein [Streptomyces sp. CB02959]|uniref:hypothetical protein n=1 Tax=Streptomyces sp. CB02959 TaxID=2020330 RepID=UPI0026A6E014